MFGPPDRVAQNIMHWLIIPGPPISCYLAYCPPPANPVSMRFYHLHPTTFSIHVVLSGRGKHCEGDQVFDVGPGYVMYQGPNVPHSIYPDPDSHLSYLTIQHPSPGWDRDWVVHPESGTPERYGDVGAFLERFGTTSGEEFYRRLGDVFHMSERWAQFVHARTDKK